MESSSSLSHALKLLGHFSFEEPVLGVSELARRADLPKSTTSRLLIALRREGFVVPAGKRGLRLGTRLYELGRRAQLDIELREAACFELLQLRNRSGETAHLTILDGADVLLLDYVAADATWRSLLRAGVRAAPNATSCGKILLAHSKPAVLDTLIKSGLRRLTPKTVADPEDLVNVVNTARANGFAASLEEVNFDTGSVSVPIFDGKDELLGALSIISPSSRYGPAVVLKQATLLRASSRAIQRRL